MPSARVYGIAETVLKDDFGTQLAIKPAAKENHIKKITKREIIKPKFTAFGHSGLQPRQRNSKEVYVFRMGQKITRPILSCAFKSFSVGCAGS